MLASTIGTLLRQDVEGVQEWLDSFYAAPSRRQRRAWLGRTGEYVVVEALPLPDGYAPDEIDALLLVDNYPSLPPIGIYLLNRGNEHVVEQLRRKFRAFQDQAFHDAPSIEGYTWICYAYANNAWRYRASEPHKGDNLRKFIASFFAEAQQ